MALEIKPGKFDDFIAFNHPVRTEASRKFTGDSSGNYINDEEGNLKS
jgi:hypothetical protein